MQGSHEERAGEAQEQGQEDNNQSMEQRLQAFADEVDSKDPDGAKEVDSDVAEEADQEEVDQAEAPAAEEGTEEAPQAAPPEPKAFDYSYKAYGEVKEIPDEYRSLIKDEESRAKVARLMSSVAGVEGLKTQHRELEQKYTETHDEYEKIVTDAQRMYGLVQKGDIDTLLDLWRVPFEQKIKFAQQMAQVHLNPELRQQYNLHRQDRLARIQHENEVQQLERQNQSYEQQQAQWQEQQHDAYLRNRVASDQKLAQIEQLYNQHHGEDSFMKEVWEQGKYVSGKTGKPVDPEQILARMAKPYEPLIAQATHQPQAPVAPPQQSTPQAQPKEKPIIPVTGKGAGHSPVRQNFKSVDDLEKYYEQEFGAKS